METPEPLVFDAEAGSALAALAMVPIEHRAWRSPQYPEPREASQPHIWTPDGVTLPPGPVWVVCARTKSGNPSLRVYPLRDAAGEPLAFAALGTVAAGMLATARLTRREVILGGGLALIAALLPWAAQEPARIAPPEWRLVRLEDAAAPAVCVEHACLALERSWPLLTRLEPARG